MSYDDVCDSFTFHAREECSGNSIFGFSRCEVQARSYEHSDGGKKEFRDGTDEKANPQCSIPPERPSSTFTCFLVPPDRSAPDLLL